MGNITVADLGVEKAGRAGRSGAKGRMVEQIMRRHDYNPIEAMVVLVTKGEEIDEDDHIPLPLDLQVAIHKELAQYRYPKKKAIEVSTGAGPLAIAVVSGIEGAPGSAVPDDDLGID